MFASLRFPVTNHRILSAPVVGRITAIEHHGTTVDLLLHTGASLALLLEDVEPIVRTLKRDLRGLLMRFDGRAIELQAAGGAC
ncbi:MAG: hypothetical protein KatS3mg062_0507 [Tepidiforma sp.]|nr:MAG: hypothetical protein KatS3mg062_0507 [Tepidiforma sp.]